MNILAVIPGSSVTSVTRVTTEGQILRSGSGTVQVLNPCKFSNVQHLVAMLRGSNLRRQIVNILRTRISPSVVQQQAREHCNTWLHFSKRFYRLLERITKIAAT